ncbi:EAL domain-containing protein [Amycolatopsis mongoliensis]|uniref:EAL domain-containing protein n=1 Tax=Amycolatopsis mongoliensis TaxID=715475 RepID=A0A9Y2JVU2_9PSEU|nr:EAL domain-containing protein [Amycolatopsis sp. 4-36]WIY05600.1 EAL domain-containing protein [Amycolatopsis sp. 4-36]
MTPSAPRPTSPQPRRNTGVPASFHDRAAALLARISAFTIAADDRISDPVAAADVAAAVREARTPAPAGLVLTVDDAIDFGHRWYAALTSDAYLQIHRRFAEQQFGRWTAAMLTAFGAPVLDPHRRLGPPGDLPAPRGIGYELAYVHKLPAAALGTCVALLSDLAAEYTPGASRATRTAVVGAFASGFGEGLQERVRDEQTALTSAFLHLNPATGREDGPAARRFRAAVADTVTAVLALDEHGGILEANTTAQNLLGATLAALRGRTLAELAMCADDAEQITRAAEALRTAGADLPGAAQAHVEFRITSATHPGARWLTATLGRAGGTQRGYSVVLEDVTFLRGLERGIDIEPSTGLLTEQAFTAQTARILTESRDRIALLTIRLSGWSHLDHVLPQELRAGLLSQLHTRIRAAHDPVRHRQLVGRRGDEVLVLLYDLTDWSTVIHLVKQLSDWLRDPVHLDAHQIRLHPRIGVAQARPADTLDDLLRRARRALHDPAHARVPWIHVDPVTQPATGDDRHRVELLAELTSVLEAGTLGVDYQPICTPAGALAAVWPQPYWLSGTGARRELAEIAELAEHTGLLAAALPHVLATAARDTTRWTAAGRVAPAVLLGLPGATVHDDALLDTLTAQAADSGLPVGCLHLAIPARALTGAPAVLRRLRELPTGPAGIRLALTEVLDDHVPIEAFTTVPWAMIGLTAATVTALTTTPAGTTPLVAALTTIRAFGAQALTDVTEGRPPHRGFDLHHAHGTITADLVHTLLSAPGTRA